jgi:hypothetical protein
MSAQRASKRRRHPVPQLERMEEVVFAAKGLDPDVDFRGYNGHGGLTWAPLAER